MHSTKLIGRRLTVASVHALDPCMIKAAVARTSAFLEPRTTAHATATRTIPHCAALGARARRRDARNGLGANESKFINYDIMVVGSGKTFWTRVTQIEPCAFRCPIFLMVRTPTVTCCNNQKGNGVSVNMTYILKIRNNNKNKMNKEK